MTGGKVIEVECACPECGNRNRAARRACGSCKGTGKTTKFLPAPENGPASYPDVTTNPVDPPTVSGTDISRDVG